MVLAPGGDYPQPDAIFVRITLIHNPGAGDDDQPGAEELSARQGGQTPRPEEDERATPEAQAHCRGHPQALTGGCRDVDPDLP